jgi:hypothetical protein
MSDVTHTKPYSPKEMEDLVEWLEKNRIVPTNIGDRLMATAKAARYPEPHDPPPPMKGMVA